MILVINKMQIKEEDLQFEGGHAINQETELPEYKTSKDGIVNKSRRQQDQK